MAQPSYASPSDQSRAAVVSSQYCSPSPADLVIVRKCSLHSRTTFVVTDPSDNVIFEVKGPGFTWHYHVVLLDAAGNPVITIKPKRGGSRWKAYRGESTDEKDLLFSMKPPSIFKPTKLNMFLANNVREDRGDFRVEMNWLGTSCVIYAEDSNSVIAQMHEKATLFGKDKFMVTLQPNVDAAFVTAILIMLDEISNN